MEFFLVISANKAVRIVAFNDDERPHDCVQVDIPASMIKLPFRVRCDAGYDAQNARDLVRAHADLLADNMKTRGVVTALMIAAAFVLGGTRPWPRPGQVIHLERFYAYMRAELDRHYAHLSPPH